MRGGDGSLLQSSHWGRELQKLGHQVKLIAPAYVELFVKRTATLRNLRIIGRGGVSAKGTDEGDRPARGWSQCSRSSCNTPPNGAEKILAITHSAAISRRLAGSTEPTLRGRRSRLRSDNFWYSFGQPVRLNDRPLRVVTIQVRARVAL